jgi:hypothetical protein
MHANLGKYSHYSLNSKNVTTGLSKFIYAIGTGTAFDFGTYDFDQTVQHGKTLALKISLAFPTLLLEFYLFWLWMFIAPVCAYGL